MMTSGVSQLGPLAVGQFLDHLRAFTAMIFHDLQHTRPAKALQSRIRQSLRKLRCIR